MAAARGGKKARRIGFAALGILLAAILWYSLTLWRYAEVGPFWVRKNIVTGTVQIRRGGDWSYPFGNDRYAERISPKDLKLLRLGDIHWGPDGILAGRTQNTSDKRDVKGRVSFRVMIRGTDGKVQRDRSFSETVDWPAGLTYSWVLRTGLSTPSPKEKTVVRLEAIE